MSRRNNQNNQYNGNNQYYGNNGQYYNGNGNNQYYGNNGQYYNGQYNQNQQYNQNFNRNGQYYNKNTQYNQQQKPDKFGLYNQPYQTIEPKKKIDKSLLIKIGLFVGGALIIILLVFAMNSCGKKEDCDKDFRKVGNESYGYVCIPSDWVNFEEDPPNRSVQYSNVDGTYIITIDALPTTQINAKDYALGVANNLEQKGITTQGSESKIDDYDAYQVTGQLTDENNNSVWVLAYFFEDGKGSTHYLGIEGPDKNDEAFKIPESFMIK